MDEFEQKLRQLSSQQLKAYSQVLALINRVIAVVCVVLLLCLLSWPGFIVAVTVAVLVTVGASVSSSIDQVQRLLTQLQIDK